MPEEEKIDSCSFNNIIYHLLRRTMFLGRDAVQSDTSTNQGDRLLLVGFLLPLHFCLEDGGNLFFRNAQASKLQGVIIQITEHLIIVYLHTLILQLFLPVHTQTAIHRQCSPPNPPPLAVRCLVQVIYAYHCQGQDKKRGNQKGRHREFE